MQRHPRRTRELFPHLIAAIQFEVREARVERQLARRDRQRTQPDAGQLQIHEVADPLDLVRSRDEGRPDIVKRMGAIAKIRDGKDPSTQYRSTTPQINSTVGGGT